MAEDCDCKIDRNAAKYDLADIDEELYHRHQNQGASLRDLETYVNQRILGSVLRGADIVLVEGAESVYRVLTGEDASEGRRAELKSRLGNAGIDVDDVERDFVTYGTVRKHLREGVGVDTGTSASLDAATASDRIQRLQSRSTAVVGETLDQLRRADSLATGELDIVVSARVTCERCGGSYRVGELLERGRCECGGE
jgi:hypothetical protein